MIQVIKCPSCAAPLECDGDAFEKCVFCGSRVAINQNNVFSENNVGFNGLLQQAHILKDILRLVRSGHKIEAIKLYRETSGVSLLEAKNAVERLERGESVNFQHVRFQNGNGQLPEVAKTALKAAGIFGGSMLLFGLIMTLIILGAVGGILWVVFSKVSQVTTQLKPPVTSVPKASEKVKPVFASEILRFGGEGNGAGKFTDNRALAVDGEGKIYSADYQGGRVQVFDKDGKFLTQWFVAERDSIIYSLAVNRSGTVFVTQPNGKITSYEGSSGKLLNEAKPEISSALYTTLDGKIIAANRTDILVIDENLKVVSTFKNAAPNAGIQSGFNYLAVNGLGEIFAINRFGKDLVKFSADGKFVDRFKVKPTSVQDLAVDPKGRIFIAETNEVFVYQPDGNLIDSFKTNQCYAIAFNDQGELLMISRPFVVKYTVN
jgi:DNA-binding beta-propeller fold protein YncE